MSDRLGTGICIKFADETALFIENCSSSNALGQRLSVYWFANGAVNFGKVAVR